MTQLQFGPRPRHRPFIVIGAGYLGQHIALQATRSGFDPVIAIKRQPIDLAGVKVHGFDISAPGGQKALTALVQGVSENKADASPLAIVYALSPDQRTPAAYQKAYHHGLQIVFNSLLDTAQKPNNFHIILTSSTSVYQEEGGGWVDESAKTWADQSDQNTAENQSQSRAVAQGEKLLQDSGHIWTVLRYGGIYGPARRSFVQRVINNTEFLALGEPIFTNRIHVVDGARIAVHVAINPACQNQSFNAVDTDPADRNEVVTFLWQKFGDPSRPLNTTDNRQLITHSSHKRVMSGKIQATGFTFKYPSYKEGYET
jgi:nucleoside-diphosphate-sugar epimerase